VWPDTCPESSGGFGVRARLHGLLFKHWNGTGWAIEPQSVGWAPFPAFPTLGGSNSTLAFAGDTGWVIGSDTHGTLVAQLRGGVWRPVTHPTDRRSYLAAGVATRP
jgi:hypothetical protein